MPKSKSKSKSSARVARYAGLSEHPAVRDLDPLLAARLGSQEPLRLPDSYNRPTAATVLKSEYTLSSDAAGELTFGESYNLSGAKLSATVTAGTLSGITTTAHPQFTAFTAEAKVARMVLMRIQVTYVGREDASSGYLSYDEKTETAYGATTMGDNHTSSLVQVDAQHGLTVVLSHTQEPRWEVPTTATFMKDTYQVASFFASALPASAVVYRVRVWRFMEYLPFDGAISEGNLHAEPHNPAALAVHSLLSGISTSISTVTSEGFIDGVKRAANAAYHIAAPLTPWVVGRARQYLKQMAMSTGGPLLLGALAAAV